MAWGIDFAARLPDIAGLNAAPPPDLDALHAALRGSLTHTILEWTPVQTEKVSTIRGSACGPTWGQRVCTANSRCMVE